MKNLDNFAVMRHAEMARGTLQITSLEILQRVAYDLHTTLNKNVGRVRVFHSPQARAELTAFEFVRALMASGRSAEIVGPLAWLDCEHYTVTDKNIEQEVRDGTFTVFITHLPDMKNFLRSTNTQLSLSVTNCALYSPGFTIQGH